jgi:uncharacterized protein YqeY
MYTFVMTHPELRTAITQAMKERQEVRLSVLRGLLTACTNELVAKGRKPTEELSEEDVQALVRRAAKQRKDSIEQFEKGGREDLAAKEREELAVLEAMLPAQMTKEAVEAIVRAKAAEMGITDKTKANQLMGALMKDLKGKADGLIVKEVIGEILG